MIATTTGLLFLFGKSPSDLDESYLCFHDLNFCSLVFFGSHDFTFDIRQITFLDILKCHNIISDHKMSNQFPVL